MAVQSFTLIDAQAIATVDISVDGSRFWIGAPQLESTTGWSVKPEGFCRGDICVPAGDAGALSIPAGRVFGLTRLLARLPEHLAAGRMPLPLSMLAAHGLTPVALSAGVVTPAVRDLIATTVHGISDIFATLRPQIKSLSRQQRVALLPLAVVAPYLKVKGRSGRNPLRDIADLAPLTRVWRIAMAHAVGWYG